jgi:hypothetical protein
MRRDPPPRATGKPDAQFRRGGNSRLSVHHRVEAFLHFLVDTFLLVAKARVRMDPSCAATVAVELVFYGAVSFAPAASRP